MNKDLTTLSIADLATMIKHDWQKVYFGAEPYLDAMLSLDKITDDYCFDNGSSIVAYFLGNANTWRGETARAVKAELNRRLKGV